MNVGCIFTVQQFCLHYPTETAEFLMSFLACFLQGGICSYSEWMSKVGTVSNQHKYCTVLYSILSHYRRWLIVSPHYVLEYCTHSMPCSRTGVQPVQYKIRWRREKISYLCNFIINESYCDPSSLTETTNVQVVTLPNTHTYFAFETESFLISLLVKSRIMPLML